MSSSSDEASDVEHLSDVEDFPMSDEEAAEKKGSSWAAAMKKTLKSQNTGALSKANKTREIERIKEERKGYGFEIDGEVKMEQATPEVEQPKKKSKERREVRETLLQLRVKPTLQDREREKTLQKIATKGLVQLFNAVRSQQKDLEEKLDEVGKPQYKRDKVLKNVSKKTFLDALMSGPRAKSELVDNPVKFESKKRKAVKEEELSDDSDDSGGHRNVWSALKDDFMASSQWDKEGSD